MEPDCVHPWASVIVSYDEVDQGIVVNFVACEACNTFLENPEGHSEPEFIEAWWSKQDKELAAACGLTVRPARDVAGLRLASGSVGDKWARVMMREALRKTRFSGFLDDKE